MQVVVIFDKDGVILNPSGETERIRAYWHVVERCQPAEAAWSWRDYWTYHNTELSGAPRDVVAQTVVNKLDLSAGLCEMRPDLKRHWEAGEFTSEEYEEVQEQIQEGIEQHDDILNFPPPLVLTVLRLIEYACIPLSQRCLPAPGVMTFLDFLVKRHSPLALITENRFKRTQMELTHLGIADAFEVIACKDQFFSRGQIEPSPGNKQAMYSALRDHFAPARCLAIEDSAKGAQAAVGASLPVLWIAGDLPLTDLLHALLGQCSVRVQ